MVSSTCAAATCLFWASAVPAFFLTFAGHFIR
jgi:hypothetical protein